MDTPITDQTPEAASVNVGVTEERPSVPAPADSDDLSRLLAEYDSANPPAPEQPIADNTAPAETADQSLAELLQDSASQSRIDELTGQVDALRLEQQRARDLEDFQSLVDGVHKQMPDWLPPEYTRARLAELAHDPAVAQAFDYRNYNRQAATDELRKVQFELVRSQLPGANITPERVAELRQYENKLVTEINIAASSAGVLRQAKLRLITEANKLPQPYDPDLSQIRADVAWAVKSSGSYKRMPEVQPDWGRMDSQTYRREVRDRYGYDPGT